MSVFLACLVVAVFALAVGWLDLPSRAREAGAGARETLAALRDPSMDDRARETALRRQAVRMFGLFGRLAGGGLLALGLPLLGVWLLELGGVGSLASVLSVLERPDFLAAVTVTGLLVWAGLRSVRGS